MLPVYEHEKRYAVTQFESQIISTHGWLRSSHLVRQKWGNSWEHASNSTLASSCACRCWSIHSSLHLPHKASHVRWRPISSSSLQRVINQDLDATLAACSKESIKSQRLQSPDQKESRLHLPFFSSCSISASSKADRQYRSTMQILILAAINIDPPCRYWFWWPGK